MLRKVALAEGHGRVTGGQQQDVHVIRLRSTRWEGTSQMDSGCLEPGGHK